MNETNQSAETSVDNSTTNTSSTTETPQPIAEALEPSDSTDYDQVEADLIAIGFDNPVEDTPVEGVENTLTEVDSTTGEPATKVESNPAAQAAQPQAAVGDPTAVVAEAAKVEGEQPTGEAGPAAKADTPSQDDLSGFAQAVFSNRNVIESALVSKVYNLSDDVKSELELNPGEVIPKLFAKAHMEILTNVVGAIASNLPRTISSHLERTKQSEVLENQFWDAHKAQGLDKAKHTKLVSEIAGQYAKMFPQADSKTRIRNVGALALLQAGLTVGAPAPTVQAAAGQRAFVPAANGGAAPASKQTPNSNPFTEMFNLMVQDDQ